MMDLEQANRILDLKQGATFRQVSEAREDLLALWNPDRLSDHPRLRAKAAIKIKEINQAYEGLMEHLGQDDAPGDRGFDPVPEPTPSAGSIADSGQAAPARGDHRASLYEEVFSRRKEEEGRQIPVWPIVGGVLFLVLVIVLYQSWSSEEVAGDPEAAPTEELASEPPVTVPVGAPASASAGETAAAIPDTAAEEVEDVPGEAPQAGPPAERAVVAPPKTEPPPPARAPTSTPPASRPTRPQADQSPESGQRPALRRESATSESTEEETRREEEERQQAEKFEQVFRDLLANSAAARKLVDEEFTDLRFARWRVVDQTDSEIWIELVAQKSDGNSVHFTWAINPADGTTRALSAAARSLERSGQAN